MNIIEAAKAMNEGKKIRRAGWMSGSYIRAAKKNPLRMIGDGYMILCANDAPNSFSDTGSLLATDYEVVE